MNPDQAPRFPSGRACFAAETGCVGDEFFWQITGSKNLFPVKISHWDLCGRSQEQLPFLQAVHIRLELRQLSGPDHAVASDEKRRAQFLKSVFPCVKVEHELD